MTMNKIIAAVSFDRAALAAVAMASTLTIGEAYTRTSLGDAQSAMEARYPPLSSIITEGELMYKVLFHVRQAADPLPHPSPLCSSLSACIIYHDGNTSFRHL